MVLPARWLSRGTSGAAWESLAALGIYSPPEAPLSGITAITCTGDRPVPFVFCVEYMAGQSRRPDQWIIVDDGKEPLVHAAQRIAEYCQIGDVQIIRRSPRWSDPPHTLPLNLLAALECVARDRVAFIEDDDWYSDRHLEVLEKDLQGHELVGAQGIVYYHVGRRCHRTMGATSPHSALCQTGITASVIPLLKKICTSIDSGSVDLRLWREFAGKKKLSTRGTVVGIKGLPGRPGLTVGWRSVSGYTPDPSLAFLESLIGEDVANYQF